MNLESILDVAISAAKKAGVCLSGYYQKQYVVSTKGSDHNLVTEADLAAEKIIIETILSAFPDHNILSEETGAIPANPEAPIWIIDPLDGTFNFVHHLPLFAVSIGVQFQGEFVCGVVYAPLLQELFFARKGNGAYLNERSISVSTVSDMARSSLVTGVPYYDQGLPHRGIEQFVKMLELGCPIRDLGSCAIDLSYLAAGRFDGYWMPTVHPWDFAGGAAILLEAGGKITLYNGSVLKKLEISPIIASNGLIHSQLQHVLHD